MLINEKIIEGYENNLKSMLYGLLREREKDGNWEAFLDHIIIQLEGYPEEYKTINYFKVLCNVNSLKRLRFKYFRTTVFDTISLIGKKERNSEDEDDE